MHLPARLALLLYTVTALPAATVIIRDVTLIDATGAPVRPHMSVIVVGQKITAVGPAVSTTAPKGAQTINGAGKFLIPGLWDMHVHLWEKQNFFPLYIANGVTGVRDMGSNFQQTVQWRKDIAAGKLTGPRIITPGPAVMGPNLNAGKLPVIRISTPAEAENAANQLDDQDADFIKILSNIPHDAYITLAHRARLLRLPFAGHVPDAVTMEEAIDARQRSMEHLFGLNLACSSEEHALRIARQEAAGNRADLARLADRTYQTYDPAKAHALFQRFTRFDVWQVPTLTLRERMDQIGVEALATDPSLKYIPASVKKTWDDPRDDLKKATPEDLAHGKRDFARCLEIVAGMRRANVPLMAGTDTGDPYVLPGFSLHDELALLVRAGLTPMEAIQTATINPAKFLGIEATHGAIQKGKIADMVLLDANPLADIQNTKKIRTVIVNGAVFTRENLNALLTKAEAVK